MIVAAAGGERGEARRAKGDGTMNTSPDARDRRRSTRRRAASGPIYGKVDRRVRRERGRRAKKIAKERSAEHARWAATLSTELALPRDFEAVAELVREEDLEGALVLGNDPAMWREKIDEYERRRLHARLPARRVDATSASSSSSRSSSVVSGRAGAGRDLCARRARRGQRRLERPLLEADLHRARGGLRHPRRASSLLARDSPRHSSTTSAGTRRTSSARSPSASASSSSSSAAASSSRRTSSSRSRGSTVKEKSAWWKVAELWTVSPVFNIARGRRSSR